MRMWPFWGLEMNRTPCDLSFMEAISQQMQVPNRLKMVDESSLLEVEREAEEFPPSLRMHIPDRLSLAGMRDTGLRPLLLDQLRQHPSIIAHTPEDPSTQPAAFGELLFLNASTRSGTQKRKRSVHPSRLRKERTRSENPQLALHSASEKPDRPDTSMLPSPAFPPFTHDGRIFSLQNIIQMVCFLGHLLFHRVKKSAHVQAQPSSQDTGLAPESSLEELCVTDFLAMRKQLNKISGRLRTLEEQCTGWRQKELLIYSVLVSACLINTWLWLKR